MRPEVKRFLDVAAAQLMTQTAPALGGYAQSSVSIMAMMLLEVGLEFERGAARRVDENQALRALFRDAGAVVQAPELAAKLSQAVDTRDDDLTISALEAGNAALRALLIELHAHVEELQGDAARRMEDAIWRELAASTERRRLNLGAF